MEAWLILWEWPDGSVPMKDKVVHILCGEKKATEVQGVLEILYAPFTFSLLQRKNFAQGRSLIPPDATARVINSKLVTCGRGEHCLEARLVTDLEVTVQADSGYERITWKEQDRSGALVEKTYVRTRHVLSLELQDEPIEQGDDEGTSRKGTNGRHSN
jgi:hypothetical protein